jgi:hypothetical protein
MVTATSAALFTAIPATPQASRVVADSTAVAASLAAADDVKQTSRNLDLTMASSRYLEAIVFAGACFIDSLSRLGERASWVARQKELEMTKGF